MKKGKSFIISGPSGVGKSTVLKQLLADYQEPVPGARDRVEKVLRIMLTAWAAAMLRQNAQLQIQKLQ